MKQTTLRSVQQATTHGTTAATSSSSPSDSKPPQRVVTTPTSTSASVAVRGTASVVQQRSKATATSASPRSTTPPPQSDAGSHAIGSPPQYSVPPPAPSKVVVATAAATSRHQTLGVAHHKSSVTSQQAIPAAAAKRERASAVASSPQTKLPVTTVTTSQQSASMTQRTKAGRPPLSSKPGSTRSSTLGRLTETIALDKQAHESPAAPDDIGQSGCAVLRDRFVVVTGGLRRSNNEAVDTIACFDTQTRRWLPQFVPSPSAAVNAVLPQPLYGHCCISHGNKSVWLIGGLNGKGGVSRTILRLNINILDGSSGVSPSDQAGDEYSVNKVVVASGFTVSNVRSYDLPFPVALAACVKLQGALNPVALVLGGLSTQRDDFLSESGRGSNAQDRGSAAPLHSNDAAGRNNEEHQSLGMTNRVFALNLTDCSIFRVAQTQVSPGHMEIPSPRILAAATPIIRQDISGSYGSIFYMGGITTQPPPGGSDGGADRAIYVGSVSHDAKAKTFALRWSRFTRRSIADPWPQPVAAHSLCAIQVGVAVVLGGCPSEAESQHGDDDASCRTCLSEGSVMGILFDAATGVSCSEMMLAKCDLSGDHHNSHNNINSNNSTLREATLRRFVVTHSEEQSIAVSAVQAAGGPHTNNNNNNNNNGCSGGSGIVGGEHHNRITIFSIAGGLESVSTHVIPVVTAPSPSDTAKSPLTGKSVRSGWDCCLSVDSADQNTAHLSAPEDALDDDEDDVVISVRAEMLQTSVAAQAPRPIGAFANGEKEGKWTFTMPRRCCTMDDIGLRIARDTASYLDPVSLARIFSAPQKREPRDHASIVRLIANNLVLYGVGSAGERVPLSSDAVLSRMVERCCRQLSLSVSCYAPIQNFKIVNKLGQGSFGSVYMALFEQTTHKFAVKHVTCKAENRSQLLREIRLMRSLDHPNIVRYLGVDFDERRHKAKIFMEYVGDSNLNEFFRKIRPVSISVIRAYLRQIVAALTYLHSYQIVHQDIKAANVLIGHENAKLADFGTARQLTHDTGEDGDDAVEEFGSVVDDGFSVVGVSPRRSSPAVGGLAQSKKPSSAASRNGIQSSATGIIQGTCPFIAPEVLLQPNHAMTTASDIWSLGCLLIEMATGNAPWKEEVMAHRVEQQALVAFIMEQLKQCRRPKYPSPFPKSGIQFLDDCLVFDPCKRKKAAELMTHPFLTEDETEDDYESATLPTVGSHHHPHHHHQQHHHTLMSPPTMGNTNNESFPARYVDSTLADLEESIDVRPEIFGDRPHPAPRSTIPPAFRPVRAVDRQTGK